MTMNEFYPNSYGSMRRELVSARNLQGPPPPTYTSPPTDIAVKATPEAYRSDEVIDAARAKAAMGRCSPDNDDESSFCHIPFHPDEGAFGPSKVGVVFFGGAFVDPRGYAPLAKSIAERYGIPVVIPIFTSDISLTPGTCESGRLPMAAAQFQNVEKWILTGHSLGGIAATADAWNSMTNPNATIDFDMLGGLTLLAADVLNFGCGPTDFSNTDFPMALSSATEDEVLNRTRYDLNRPLSSNATYFLEIYGGNHGQFGSYDDSGRVQALGPSQVDGTAFIPPQVQWDLSTAAIFHVASRSGVPLPQELNITDSPTGVPSASPTTSTTNAPSSPRQTSNPPTLLCPEIPSGSAALSFSFMSWTTLLLLLLSFRR
eukprot:CAMPEP_0117058854 /NCGR_PEP_ID=MMETSP0472-20121206/40870_1 /TAXON_ID=693140 ORGANISM="Tiarina fusus, Strain LIS" /NCGR_SAMPLE_ID=MMETSP0472 /ASSEMBLY_ACC=CAM_ASM_000603 /LENGTH=372 /DNA_ID=CAMNT_0004776311 /DNA_START=142 /DNA_END=1260 /DNA_ORIENTATION=-